MVNFFILVMCIFKLLIQIQISLSRCNIYLADKVMHIVNKTTTKRDKNTKQKQNSKKSKYIQ